METATLGVPTAAAQMEQFTTAVFDPDDIIEIRRLPSGVSSWHAAAELSGHADALEEDNRRGQNIYIGANPRPRLGARGDSCIVRAHCLFADFDGGATVDEALSRIDERCLPRPTATIFSGHGVHVWWRLDDPVDDLGQWRAWQKRLISALNSDGSIHNPERIMRLPGFKNHKPPPADCYIAECDPERTHDVDKLTAWFPSGESSFPFGWNLVAKAPTDGTSDRPEISIERIIDAAKYATKWEGITQGNEGRSPQGFRHAAQLLHDFGLSKAAAWPLLKAWNEKNDPPLSEGELKKCLCDGEKYGGKPEHIRPKVGKPAVEGPKWHTLADLHALPSYREGLIPVTTGFGSLDRALNGGFRPANSYVIGGRTGSAKSTLAANVVRRAALAGVRASAH